MTISQAFRLLLGPLVFGLILMWVPESAMPMAARAVLACTAWVAIWWVTEALPIAATSLLPLVIFPLTGALDMAATAKPYADKLLFLFIGGFIIALAMEKWNLHRRIALNIVALAGTNRHRLILGFIAATGLLSMWISNTATTVMMLPIGMAIIGQFKGLENTDAEVQTKFGKALMLAIAYAASIGGVATLVGTPTNLIFAGAVEKYYSYEVAFIDWMKFGLPISLVMLIIAWQMLVRVTFRLPNGEIPGSQALIQQELKKLGPIKYEEKWVLAIFVVVAFCWVSRKFLLSQFIPNLNDTIIALAGALVLFVIPSKEESKGALIDWKTAVRLPWEVILLFGAGFAIAAGFEASGLATWIGGQLTSLATIPFILLLLTLVAVVNFLTEITSNMATCTLMMPILAEIAQVIGAHPYGLMAATCVAASCAFMLPVATAPNAVVFGSGYLKMSDMVRAGFFLNVISILLVVVAIYGLLPVLWGIELAVYPF
ncbi:MAG: SLC13 family permease [Bacteroidota bacterium]